MGNQSQAIEVGVVDLGHILARYGVPLYMKVDVEGADRACLEYLRAADDRPAYLSIEDEKVDFLRLGDDLSELCTLGYNRFRVVQQSTIPGTVYSGTDCAGLPIEHKFEYGASGPFGPDLDGPWMTRNEVMIEYKWIFEMYRLFGNDSPCAADPDLARLRQQLAARLGRPLPGWYDTHAAR